MAKLIAGIDLGLSGAIAIYDSQGPVFVHDMPIAPKTTGKGNEVEPYQLAKILTGVSVAYIEEVAAMPGQGVSSVFKFGDCRGVARGVLAGLGCATHFVRPQAWKRAAGLLKKDKGASRTLAMRMWPGLSDQLSRKKDDGRAEALLIGYFAAKALNHG